jgi:hypothetical protein
MTHGHTKGPWHLDLWQYDAAIHAGGTIAMIDDTMTGWQANARLIAAAPDLLAALAEIAAAYAMEEDTPEHNHEDRLDAAIKAGVAAIAKAKGD